MRIFKILIANSSRYTRRGIRSKPGFTLVEMLVASMLLGVSIMGLVGTWTYMLNSTLNTDDRATAYECARSVMERARSLGFMVNYVTQASQTNPPMFSPYRFFSSTGSELSHTDDPTVVPDGARYRVQTQASLSAGGTRPGNRPDLQMLTLSVTVVKINLDKTTGNVMFDEQTSMSEGGL